MQEKDSEQNNLCTKLRESLGIDTQWKMAQRLNVPYSRWNMAEVRSKGRISLPLLARVVRVFGWAKVAPLVKKELETLAGRES